MTYRLFSLYDNAPSGFDYCPALEQRDVRRWPFALLAKSCEEAEAALAPFGTNLAGIIVTLETEQNWQQVGPLLFHLSLPRDLHTDLALLLHSQLDFLTRLQQAENRYQAQTLELDRAREESKRNKLEFALIKSSLVDELSIRRMAVEALRNSEEHFRLLTENVSDVVWKADKEYRITYISPADERLRGYQADEVVGCHAFELFSAETIAAISHKFSLRQIAEQNGIKTGTIIFEAQHRCKNGKLVWAEICSTPQRNEAGEIIGYHGISREITERKKNESEQLKIEKLESLGVLAGGIAHDFNNLLTGILGNITFAQMFLDASHKSFKPLIEAENASARATELAQQLLTFARGGEPIKKRMSLQHLVNESISLVLHGSNVKGMADVPDSIDAIDADEGQLSQVCHNIIINATQAMPGGGMLTVSAENEILGEGNGLTLPAGTYVKVAFTDQGCGISEEHQKKIFDPYFTTKLAGNGLGLASVHSIVHRHGGAIEVHSTVGNGTTFTIHLPSTGESFVAHSTSVAVPDAADHSGGVILVMDDEEMIRDMTAEMLVYLGYQAESCCDGADAVSRYRAARDAGTPFSAVIMDLTIPGGMGGKEAAGHILTIDPKACLIVSSGYSNDPIMSGYRTYGFSGAVAKPYKIQEFAQLLSSTLTVKSALPRP